MSEVVEFLMSLVIIGAMFVAFMVILGPLITFILDVFIPYDDFPSDGDDDDDDDGYGF